jgi:hypothetical protein
MKTELGKFRLLAHFSLVNDGTKLAGIALKDLKKSRGFSFLAFLIDKRVVLAFWL